MILVALRAYLARVRNWLGAHGNRGSEDAHSSETARPAAPSAEHSGGHNVGQTGGQNTGHTADRPNRASGAAAHPEDLPQPAVGGLKRVLHDTEIAEIADNLITSGQVQPTRADVAVAITKLINELPGERDMELVRSHLEAAGFPPLWGDEDGAPGTPPKSGPDPDPAGKDGHDR